MFVVLWCVVCNFRMVKNISRGEEGRVQPEDLHRILGESCWEPIKSQKAHIIHSFPKQMQASDSVKSDWNTPSAAYSTLKSCDRSCVLQDRSQRNVKIESTYKPFLSTCSSNDAEECLDWTGLVGPPHTSYMDFYFGCCINNIFLWHI